MTLSDIIFSNTYTYTDFHRRFSLLKEFVEFLFYKNNQKHLPILERFERFCAGRQIIEENKEAIKEWGEDFFKEVVSSDDFYKVLSGIEDDFKKCPLFVLQTPVKLRVEDIREIGKWVKKNVDGRAFIILKVDPEIGAGCFFSWGNDRYDMTFESMSKRRYKEISSRVKEILNSNA